MKQRKESNVLIEVDEDFAIEVDSSNWTVWFNKDIEEREAKTNKRTGKIVKKWVEVAYCHDLFGALKAIVKQKTLSGFDTAQIKTLLSWNDTTYHSVLNRLLRSETELRKAIEKNGVMVGVRN